MLTERIEIRPQDPLALIEERATGSLVYELVKNTDSFEMNFHLS